MLQGQFNIRIFFYINVHILFEYRCSNLIALWPIKLIFRNYAEIYLLK